MECRYCEHFCTAKVRKRVVVDSKTSYHMRECPIIKKEVKTQTDNNCAHFRPHPYFYCDNTNAWMRYEVCLARQKRQEVDCKNCPQGWTVCDIVLDYSDPEPTPEPVKLVKRKKSLKRKKSVKLIKRKPKSIKLIRRKK